VANDWIANEATLAADPPTAATFPPNGAPPKMGEIFATRLARPLGDRQEGRDAFTRINRARSWPT
jgi:hypothetical protein